MYLRKYKRLFTVVLTLFCILGIQSLVKAEPRKVDRLIILGDSLSDDGGDNSTLYLLKTMNGETGDAGIDHIQPWVRSWLSDRIPGYGWFCSWKLIPCRTVERGILSAAISILTVSKAVPVLPAKHYDNGRWSNGLLWPEYLSKKMGIPTSNKQRYINVSHAGGWTLCLTDKVIGIGDLFGDLTKVAKDMINGSLIPPCLDLIAKGVHYKYGDYRPNDLAVVFFGGNDYLNLYQDPQRVVNVQAEVIEQEIEYGARNIAWLNMPDISLTPRYISGGAKDKAAETKRLIDLNNQLQEDKYRELKRKYERKGVKLVLVDANAIFKGIMDNADSYGFKDIHEPCSRIPTPGIDDTNLEETNPSLRAANEMAIPNGKICLHPEQYMFWDSVHPTTITHKIIADKACDILKENGFYCQS
ncbi:hypothetical protein D5018_03335 [Parashewanella curva]|uniref:SGNH/GDSL hydrolase family protein n=1 Tax=Parashewanella curva TaxID=2338552 RepID=A0A3L8Q3B9_9GAMM|nr:SGNH/GDSL hydrolase family protein [Parashewanella curva]RLV61142.1 hypothetical protein D5018_03335 [Parashewanella curva]